MKGRSLTTGILATCLQAFIEQMINDNNHTLSYLAIVFELPLYCITVCIQNIK